MTAVLTCAQIVCGNPTINNNNTSLLRHLSPISWLYLQRNSVLTAYHGSVCAFQDTINAKFLAALFLTIKWCVIDNIISTWRAFKKQYLEVGVCRPDTSWRQQRRLPPCPLVNALVPLKSSSRNVQFSHRVPFTKEKMPWCPCPFKKQSIQACMCFIFCAGWWDRPSNRYRSH